MRQGNLIRQRQDRHALTCPLEAPLPNRLIHRGQDRGHPALITPHPCIRAPPIVHICNALTLWEGYCS